MSGKKYDDKKPKMSLLAPKGLELEAMVMTFGAKKYGDHNWRNGIAISRYISATLRHINKFNEGIDLDEESGISHLAHARANLGMALQTLEEHPNLDDRYKKGKSNDNK